MALVAKARKRPPSHLKKREAGHHRRNKHYSQTYWPYLPMLLVVALGLVVNVLWSHSGHVLGANSNFSPSSLLDPTNEARLADHEKALTLNQQLMNAAQAKANDMVAQNFWSHDTPEGQTPWTFITAAGYNYQAAGENLAYGFSGGAATVTGWMHSTEHRANILNSNYQNVGFGVASSQDYQNEGPEVVVVAMYAEPVSSTAAAPVNIPSTTTLTSTQTVSRLQLLPGGSSEWSLLALAVLTGAALATFIIRNGLRLKRLFKKGEGLVSHHPVIDTLVVAILMTAIILTRSGGFIR